MFQFALTISIALLCFTTVHTRHLPERTRRQINHSKDFLDENGHGISLGLSQSGSGAFQGSLQGQLGILNTPDHKLQAFGRHEKTFGSDFARLAPDVNTLGLKYQHGNGADAFVSGSNPYGTPFYTATGGGSVPLGNSGNTRLGAQYSNTFGGGIKPQHSAGIFFSHNF